MKVHLTFIGAALAEWNRLNMGTEAIQFTSAIDLSGAQRHDLILHPLFRDRPLIVQARQIDIAEPALTLLLDLLPEGQQQTPAGGNVYSLPPTR